MALERNNPLPPNARNWVDVSPADRAAFTAWLNANRGAVKVISTRRDPDNGWEWVLFEVQAPGVIWEGPGLPTIAGSDVLRESDVKQIPVIETPDSAELIRKAAIGVGAILLAAVVLNRVLR